MNAIRIRTKLDSDTLYLPELRPLLGHTVEIIVTELVPQTLLPTTPGDWDAAERSARAIRDYDFDAPGDQRELDLNHAERHLR